MHPAQRNTEPRLTDSLCLSVISQTAVLDVENIGKSGEMDLQLRKLANDFVASPAN